MTKNILRTFNKGLENTEFLCKFQLNEFLIKIIFWIAIKRCVRGTRKWLETLFAFSRQWFRRFLSLILKTYWLRKIANFDAKTHREALKRPKISLNRFLDEVFWNSKLFQSLYPSVYSPDKWSSCPDGVVGSGKSRCWNSCSAKRSVPVKDIKQILVFHIFFLFVSLVRLKDTIG
jgi:hypothetical protein